jgi:hypothetical protein
MSLDFHANCLKNDCVGVPVWSTGELPANEITMKQYNLSACINQRQNITVR